MWTATRNKTPAQNAFKHFQDHGADFGARNTLDYVRQAQDFLRNPPAGTLTKIRPNGDVVRYNPATNTFGVLGPNGAPRTFFKPDPVVHGFATNLDYFYAQ
jgi:pyocin large subunit-like protein